MEKDRKKGQNGKDGMIRPMSVSWEEYESNFEKWRQKRIEARKKKQENNNKG